MATLEQRADFPAWQQLQDQWNAVTRTLSSRIEEIILALGGADPASRRALFILAGMIALVLGMLLVRLLRRARLRSAVMRAELARVTRWPRFLGYGAALIFLGTLGWWAAVAELASATLAPAVVSPDGHRKTIQHYEGGIVQAIHVHEGDVVAVGDRLLTLDDTQARAGHRELRERYADLTAQEARLLAEQDGRDDIEFPAELLAMRDIDARRVISDQTALLRSRQATAKGREQILNQRIRQVEEEIAGLHDMIAAQDRQHELLAQELASVEKLYKEGLERLPRILALQRAQAQIEADRASNRARVARDGQEIGETRMQLLTMQEQERERMNEEFTKVRSVLAELRNQVSARQDVLKRTVITAPIAGTVMNLKVTTETGVVRAGDAILDIVPGEAKLIIDAQLRPIDIDNVHPGMKARVLLTAYRQRNLPQIHGVLRSVSADSLVEDRTGRAYFLAKVEVDPDDLARLSDVRLIPGMPAEVMIFTGEQTLFEYVARPLAESVLKSFRDD